MKANIVIGANYGDEGKGTVVARLTKERTNVLNILTNGGSQRGHSILTDEGSMTFQHFGSGTYHGADSYYSAWYIMNPMRFVEEWGRLIRKPEHIYRDRRCRWSTPYDVMANLIDEEQLGRKASCGMGIWFTIKRCNEMPLMMFDEFVENPDRWMPYLASVRQYYEKRMTIPKKWHDLWESDGVLKHFTTDCLKMQALTEVADIKTLDYENLIFENGQGLLLSDTGNDTADTTPSRTGIDYALKMVRDLGITDVCAHYVTRPYLTRHGDGDMLDSNGRSIISRDIKEDRTNHHNEHQGHFRYGRLEIPLLRERIANDAQDVSFILDVTHCDEMDRLSEFHKHFDKVNAIDTAKV